jgi:hypothetical protein
MSELRIEGRRLLRATTNPESKLGHERRRDVVGAEDGDDARDDGLRGRLADAARAAGRVVEPGRTRPSGNDGAAHFAAARPRPAQGSR